MASNPFLGTFHIDASAEYSRAGGVRLDLQPGSVRVSGPLGDVVLDEMALLVLGHFSCPLSVSDAIGRLWKPSDGNGRWIRITATLTQLIKCGALTATTDTRVGSTLGSGFGGPAVHIRMVQDRRRMDAFIRAIEQTVTPDDFVLDIGTGTGVLALAAARAGARRVVAVEASPIADSAQRLFSANPEGARIELLRSHSTDISLNERATVLVTETIGVEAYDEEILSTVSDARKRLLTPDARIVPASLHIIACPVMLPNHVRDLWRFSPNLATRWHAWYGFDFSPLTSMSPGSARHCVPWSDARQMEPLAESIEVSGGSIDDPSHQHFDRQVAFTIRTGGEVDAVAMIFRAVLAPDLELSNDPWAQSSPTSWACRTVLLERPQPVQAGQVFVVRARRTHGRLTVDLVGRD